MRLLSSSLFHQLQCRNAHPCLLHMHAHRPLSVFSTSSHAFFTEGERPAKKYLVLLKRWIGIRCHSPKKKATHTRVRYASQMSNICTASVSLRTHRHHAQRNASPRPLHQGGQENPRSFLGAGIFLPGSMGFLTDAGDFRQAEGMLPPAWATPCSCLLQDLCIYVRR